MVEENEKSPEHLQYKNQNILVELNNIPGCSFQTTPEQKNNSRRDVVKMLQVDLFLSSSESDPFATDEESSYKTENENSDSDDKIRKKKEENAQKPRKKTKY